MTTIVELQEKIAKLEEELAALRTCITDDEGIYVLSGIERREVRKGLSDGLATHKEVEAVLSKYGLQGTL